MRQSTCALGRKSTQMQANGRRAETARRECGGNLSRVPIHAINHQTDDRLGCVTFGAKRSGEGRIEQVQINISRLKAFAGFQRRDRDLCWTEQHRIDSVEVAFGRFENFRKRSAIVTRCFA